MSKYGEFSTVMRDPKILCSALTEMGFVIESHKEPQSLYGYHGDERPEKAHIIIRRADTGIRSSNDIGFIREADGTYSAIISEYDRDVKFNDSWLGKLKQEYTLSRQMVMARNKGYVYQGRESVKTATGETVKLRFTVR
jgi:hypothetical protein